MQKKKFFVHWLISLNCSKNLHLLLNVKNWKILILLIYSFGSNSSFPILFSLAINKTKMDKNVLSSLKNDDIKSLTKKSYDKIVPKISSFHKKKNANFKRLQITVLAISCSCIFLYSAWTQKYVAHVKPVLVIDFTLSKKAQCSTPCYLPKFHLIFI